MEKDNMINMKRVEIIEKQIWDIYKILTENGLWIEESHVILLFLSLYKDDLISKELLLNKDKAELSQLVSEKYTHYNNNPNSEYEPIIDAFRSSLLKLNEVGLDKVVDQLFQIDKMTLKENFKEVFETILNQYTNSQGKGGDVIQSIELTRFIFNLADLPKGSKVFNPFAGLTSFGVYLDESQDYFGQELNYKTWALGVLRLMAHGKLDNSHYMCDDSIKNWPDKSNKFDLVVATPPFRMRISEPYIDGDKQVIKLVEQFLIEKGVNSLNEKGKLIALLPQSILSSGGQEHKLRKGLIENDLIDTIISLPGGLLLNTSIPSVILFINKDKKTPGKVRIVDANMFVESIGSRRKVLDDKRLNDLLQRGYIDSETVRVVNNDQIKEFDHNLSVLRYFKKHVDGVKLNDILEYIRDSSINNIPDTGKLVQIRDLKDDIVDFKLNISDVNDSKLRKSNLRLMNESCLLLAEVGNALKPTLFEYSGIPIYISHNVMCFKIDETKVLPAYLINELNTEYVKEQLLSYSLSGLIRRIRWKDLLEVVIKLPELEEQRGKVEGVSELSGKIKELQDQLNALTHGKEAIRFNEFASLKHTLGRPRQNILDWTDNLLDFMTNNSKDFESLNKSFIDFYEIDIFSALKEIKSDVNFMSDVLEKGEKGEKGFQLNDHDITLISLFEVNNIVKNLSVNNFNFKIKKLLLEGDNLKERGVNGNKILFRAMIDNLLTNAHKHGFDKKENGNEVVFELTEVDEFLTIEVRNNGKPFPHNYDREKFTTKYSTTDIKKGTGLGGYDINRIAAELKNSDWELILNEDPIYPVKFKFQFPIKIIN